MPEELKFATASWRYSPDPICILDRQGCFVALNPAWKNVLGWRKEEMLGQAYEHFLHPDDLQRSREAFEMVLSGQPVLRFENRYRTSDGVYRWLSWVAVPEEDQFFCTVRDVTEDKLREQKIEEQEREALLRKQFLAILGHDLRNPIAAISAGVRIVSKQDQSEQTRAVLRNMAASTIRMSELIENLMDLARLQLGDGITIERREMDDFGAQLEHIIQEIEAAHEETRIDLSSDLKGPVTCDGPRLMQVISNLLGNAVMHGEVGSPIEISVKADDQNLEIHVCNSGKPIPKESIETLFQPFFKGLDEDRHASPQGLGLGLFICSEIVRAHGGSIEVTSDEELTCFIVTVPR
ncbi:MAG: PAS domain-containing sensor histidine kinase [Sulfitobacter sp.]|nr:PAS domain-containing sensor histidine kinase [Sulfitobacter sp.]